MLIDPIEFIESSHVGGLYVLGGATCDDDTEFTLSNREMIAALDVLTVFLLNMMI